MKYFFTWALILITLSAAATCPVDTPASCAIDNQLANGRWDLSQVNGQYTLTGNEVFCEFLGSGFCDGVDDYNPVEGTFDISRLGGTEENYIDVACDGTITGQGHELISGTLDKTADIQYNYSTCNGVEPQDMSWDVTIDRQYDINGQVTGVGQVDLNYENDTSTITITGVSAYGMDCYWFSYDANLPDFDLSGTPESVTLSGAYDPVAYQWSPTTTPTNGTTWLDDVLHRLALNDSTEDDTELKPAGHSQPADQLYTTYFIQDTVSVSDQINHDATPEMPEVLSVMLTEPAQYIQSVSVNTQAIATIDWRGQPPGDVEFTYGGVVETVAGSNNVNWDFDAGMPGDSIQVIAIQGDQRSVPYTLAVPKVSLPPWAGSSGDWSGSGGIQYQGLLNWPISLDTTRTLNTLSLFTGDWGLANASSQYNATVYSNGGGGPGDLNTQVTFKFAGKSVDFQIQGQNTSYLSCEDMSTDGDATINIPIPGWQKTLNPLTAIPGLQSAACGLSGFLCDVIQSVGIKASANANVSGSGNYAGNTGDIQWTGGSVGGDISAQAGAGIRLPKPLHQVAGVSVSGGGSGCVDFQVAPDFDLSQLGAQIELSAQAFFMGLSASVDQSWPIGDGCGGRNLQPIEITASGWVPADGHLAMAQHWTAQGLQGVAVWSDPDITQPRPAGQLKYRFYDGLTDSWGAIQSISTDVDVNHSPDVHFDDQGNLLVIYQSNGAVVPTDPLHLDTFANSYELSWVLIDSISTQIINEGQITQNNQHDFGPEIIIDRQEQMSVFWQQATGIEITGTATTPVSVYQADWDSDNQNWEPQQLVADQLINTYGWAPAAWSNDTKVLMLTHDTDADYRTADDREMVVYRQSNGSWGAPVTLTANAVNDDNAVVDYDVDGHELMFWREGHELQSGIDGNVTGIIPLQQAAFMDGIGNGLSQAILAQHDDLKALIWAQNTQLMITTQNGDAIWQDSSEISLTENNEALSLYSAELKQGQLHLGWASREFTGTGFSDELTPYFSSQLIFDVIFSHGFEQ